MNWNKIVVVESSPPLCDRWRRDNLYPIFTNKKLSSILKVNLGKNKLSDRF